MPRRRHQSKDHPQNMRSSLKDVSPHKVHLDPSHLAQFQRKTWINRTSQPASWSFEGRTSHARAAPPIAGGTWSDPLEGPKSKSCKSLRLT